jgi:glycosyltransferase involved in cell wall biosynthesis
MKFWGVMRIKNEARWIGRVIEAQLPLVEKLYIFDDHSGDETLEICSSYEKVQVFRSPFDDLDESRDKQWLLDQLISDLPWAEINADSPHWVLALDGDEILDRDGPRRLPEIVEQMRSNVYSVRILYLWDEYDRIRIDGVYRQFHRPSVFRLINPNFRYISTPFGSGANLHCSSIPQEYLGHAVPCSVNVLHLGYMLREDRLRKYEWYNRIDPRNEGEDEYRHMVIGDLFPEWVHLKHAGPLETMALEDWRQQPR